MTEMQKSVRIQFICVTINTKVMYLWLFAINIFEQAPIPDSMFKND